MSATFFYFEGVFSPRGIFVRSHFSCPISKMFSNFPLQLNLVKQRHDLFGALDPETGDQIKLVKTKFPDNPDARI